MRAARLSVMNILKSGTIWGNEQARGLRALLAGNLELPTRALSEVVIDEGLFWVHGVAGER